MGDLNRFCHKEKIKGMALTMPFAFSALTFLIL